MLRNRLFFICLFLFAFAGCKKYPDGPAFTIRTKKARLVNAWTLQQYLVDDVDKTTTYLSGLSDFLYQLDKSGGFKRVQSSTSGTYTDEGTWEFSNDKSDLVINYTSSANVDTFEILRLKNKELWLKEKNTAHSVIYHYKKR